MKKINVFIAVTLAILMSVGVAFATEDGGQSSATNASVVGNYSVFVPTGSYDYSKTGGAGAVTGSFGAGGASVNNYASAAPTQVITGYEQVIVGYEQVLSGYTPNGESVYDLGVLRGRGYWRQNTTGDIVWAGIFPPSNLLPGSTIHSSINGLPLNQNTPPYLGDTNQSGWTYLGTNPTPIYINGNPIYGNGPPIYGTQNNDAFQRGLATGTITRYSDAKSFDTGLEVGSIAFSKFEGTFNANGLATGVSGNPELSYSKTFIGGSVFQLSHAGVQNGDSAYAGSMNKSGAVFFTKNCDFDMGNGAAASNSSSSGGAFTVGFNYAKINNDVVNPSAFNMTGNMAKVTGNPDFSKVYGNGISQTGVQVSGTVATGLSTFSYQHPTMGYGAAASWANITQNGGTITATSGGWSTSGTGQNLYKPTEQLK